MDRHGNHLSRRRFVVGVAGLGLLAGCGRLPWQPPPAAKIPRIGVQSAGLPSAVAARIEAFRQALRELGYVEGENVVIEYRYAEGELDRLPALAADLVRLQVDVIVTAAPSSTRAVREATSTIPIVMAYDTDPMANGFVASLARPGGNITGLSSLAPGISGKHLELLKETVPGLSQVAVLGTFTYPGNEMEGAATVPWLRTTETEMERAAAELRLQLQYLDVRRTGDVETVFQEARTGHAGAALVLASPILESHRIRVTQLAAQNRLPAIYHVPEFVEAGGLMSYGASFMDLWRRAASYVDKILKGTKPADLPVEQPMTFDFVVNLKTARELGITFPNEILLQVTEVIQ
jgi:putative tryptophan/tyrosine transport system substrate-binding protein